jgi:hypothetical protein
MADSLRAAPQRSIPISKSMPAGPSIGRLRSVFQQEAPSAPVACRALEHGGLGTGTAGVSFGSPRRGAGIMFSGDWTITAKGWSEAACAGWSH